MKYLITVIVLMVIMTGCTKSQNAGPVTAKPIDTDAFIHQISFAAPNQYVATSVSGDTLRMVYYENVAIYLPSQGYKFSYALHLIENFDSSILINFHYTTIDAEGDVDVDWVDNNLNNIGAAKTVKDTTINNVAETQVTVRRPFMFFKVYANNAQAVNEENLVLAINTDKINFSSYVYFTKTYPATSTSIPVYYVKAND
jgi:hypothetical protein